MRSGTTQPNVLPSVQLTVVLCCEIICGGRLQFAGTDMACD